MEDKDEQPSFLRKIADKFIRIVTGDYETTNRNAIDSITSSYKKCFGEIPEILNLGDNYDNRLELSVASFKIDYWINQLSGIFYADAERIIDIMCSYEMERRQRIVKGFTDDPIHLLFYNIKQYAIKLSRTHFDIEDIREAQRWHSLIRELIINEVFPPSHDDSRLQVLFDLELTFKKSIIPKLEIANENKSALEHIKSVSSHLVKFLDISYKYLFYIGRNSDYVPNFSMRKLRLLRDPKARENETLCLTTTELEYLEKIKNTWPIDILYKISKNELEKEKEHLALVGIKETKEIELYATKFSDPILYENQIRKMLDPFFQTGDNTTNDYYAHHISIKHFINAHILLGELSRFKELFDIAKSCAEMGGNLLTFGLLKDQIVADAQDCAKYIYAIKSCYNIMEECAWEAFRACSKPPAKTAENSEAPKKSVSKPSELDKWKDNYTKSAATYFNSLCESYALCQLSLSNLIAAATKKSPNELFKETQQVINKYLNVHSKHRAFRNHTLGLLDHLPSYNSYLSGYEKYEKRPQSSPSLPSKSTFKITNNARNDFKQLKQLVTAHQEVNYAIVSQSFFQNYANKKSDATAMYYVGRFCSISSNNETKANVKLYYNAATQASPNFFKADFQHAKLLFSENNILEAKKYLSQAMRNYEENAKNQESIGGTVNNQLWIKMNTLNKQILDKATIVQETNSIK